MQHPGSFKTMGSTAVACEENVIRKTEKKERKKARNTVNSKSTMMHVQSIIQLICENET